MTAASENLVAMVTGAGNGIGRAIVDRFLADGMQVVAVDVDAGALDRLTAELGRRGSPLPWRIFRSVTT